MFRFFRADNRSGVLEKNGLQSLIFRNYEGNLKIGKIAINDRMG